MRRRAREDGLALTSAKATGDQGQVTHVDLDRLETVLAPLPGETRKKVIGLRRVIAERMQASKRHIPHFTYVEEIDVTELEALRKRANEKSDDTRAKLTVLPFIIRALAMTLRDWPQFNARYNDEQPGEASPRRSHPTEIGPSRRIHVWRCAEQHLLPGDALVTICC